MSTVDRFELELPSALSDVAGHQRPDYLIDILGRTARTRQRPAWASPERWLPMELTQPRATVARVPWRVVAVLAALVLLTVLAAVFVGSQQRRVPPPFGPARNGLIVFDRNGDIFVGDPAATGGASSGMTSPAGDLIVGGPEYDYAAGFSPDGTKVAFLRRTPTGDQIVAADAEGSGVRVLTPTPLGNLMLAWWVPSSDGIIVDHAVGGTQRLEILHIDGRPATILADDFPADNVAFRPPDGREFVVRAEVDGAWGLYSMRVDATERRLLASSTVNGEPDQDLNSAAYSPDGLRIYYNRYIPEPEAIQAWVMNADGSNQHRFNASGPACCRWEGEMAPSPDGRWVLMWRVPPNGSGEVTLYPADGSGLGRVLQTGAGGSWAWAPDSTKVLLNHPTRPRARQLVDPNGGPRSCFRTKTAIPKCSASYPGACLTPFPGSSGGSSRAGRAAGWNRVARWRTISPTPFGPAASAPGAPWRPQ
jgi:Tol biopolymer transport system component